MSAVLFYLPSKENPTKVGSRGRVPSKMANEPSAWSVHHTIYFSAESLAVDKLDADAEQSLDGFEKPTIYVRHRLERSSSRWSRNTGC